MFNDKEFSKDGNGKLIINQERNYGQEIFKPDTVS